MIEPRLTAQDAVSQGQALTAVGRHQEAALLLRKAAANDPQDANVQCQLAVALLQAGQTKEALAVARGAVAMAPGQEWPPRVVAAVLIQMGRGREALPFALQAQRINPASSIAGEAVGEAQLLNNQLNEADESARRVIQIAPASPSGYDLRGRVALKRKRFGDAEANFREALRLDPSSWVYNNNLGMALRGQRKTKESVEAFERAVKANPASPKARKNLFMTTSAYVGAGGIFAFFELLHLLPAIEKGLHIPEEWTLPIIVGAVALAGLGFWVWRRHRQRGLSPAVNRFYELESRRALKVTLLKILFRVGPIIVVLFAMLELVAAYPDLMLLWVIVILALVVGWVRYGERLWQRLVAAWK